MKNVCIVALAIIIAAGCTKQEAATEPDQSARKSPIAITSVNHQPSDTYVKIVYGQPHKRGRTIFGELVPYGEVWRTGANEATEFTTTKPIVLNNQRVAAGTYALFTIPEEEQWTVILNDSLGQWGAFDYNADYDYIRTTVPSAEAEQRTEALTIQFAPITGDSTHIMLRWDDRKISIPITFSPADTAR